MYWQLVASCSIVNSTGVYFSALGADALVYWIGKNVGTCAAHGSPTFDSCVNGEHPSTKPGASAFAIFFNLKYWINDLNGF